MAPIPKPNSVKSRQLKESRPYDMRYKGATDYSRNPNTIRCRNRVARMTPYDKECFLANTGDYKAYTKAWRDFQKKAIYKNASIDEQKEMLKTIRDDIMNQRRREGRDAASRLTKYVSKHGIGMWQASGDVEVARYVKKAAVASGREYPDEDGIGFKAPGMDEAIEATMMGQVVDQDYEDFRYSSPGPGGEYTTIDEDEMRRRLLNLSADKDGGEPVNAEPAAATGPNDIIPPGTVRAPAATGNTAGLEARNYVNSIRAGAGAGELDPELLDVRMPRGGLAARFSVAETRARARARGMDGFAAAALARTSTDARLGPDNEQSLFVSQGGADGTGGDEESLFVSQGGLASVMGDGYDDPLGATGADNSNEDLAAAGQTPVKTADSAADPFARLAAPPDDDHVMADAEDIIASNRMGDDGADTPPAGAQTTTPRVHVRAPSTTGETLSPAERQVLADMLKLPGALAAGATRGSVPGSRSTYARLANAAATIRGTGPNPGRATVAGVFPPSAYTHHQQRGVGIGPPDGPRALYNPYPHAVLGGAAPYPTAFGQTTRYQPLAPMGTIQPRARPTAAVVLQSRIDAQESRISHMDAEIRELKSMVRKLVAEKQNGAGVADGADGAAANDETDISAQPGGFAALQGDNGGPDHHHLPLAGLPDAVGRLNDSMSRLTDKVDPMPQQIRSLQENVGLLYNEVNEKVAEFEGRVVREETRTRDQQSAGLIALHHSQAAANVEVNVLCERMLRCEGQHRILANKLETQQSQLIAVARAASVESAVVSRVPAPPPPDQVDKD